MMALVRRFGPILLVLAVLVALVASGLAGRLNLDEIQANRLALSAAVSAHPLLSLGAFLILYVLVVTACIPGPGVLTVASGFLFGMWEGGAASLAAAMVGSAAVFLACRTAFGDWAAHRAGPLVQRLERALTRNAFSSLLVMRLIPASPLFAANLAAGLARVRLRDLMAATLIGSAPSTFILAGLGSGLGEVFARGAKVDMSLIGRPQIVLPLVGLAALAALPIAWRLARRRP